MKKLLINLFYAGGLIAALTGLFVGILKPSSNSTVFYALSLLLYVLGISISIAYEGGKTRRLLRKIHGLEKEAGEED